MSTKNLRTMMSPQDIWDQTGDWKAFLLPIEQKIIAIFENEPDRFFSEKEIKALLPELKADSNYCRGLASRNFLFRSQTEGYKFKEFPLAQPSSSPFRNFSPSDTLRAIPAMSREMGGILFIDTKDADSLAWLKEQAPQYGEFIERGSLSIHQLVLRDEFNTKEICTILNQYNQA